MTSLTKQNMAWTAKKWTSGRVVQNNYVSVPSLMVCVFHASIYVFLDSSFVMPSFFICLVGWLSGHSVVRSFSHSVNWSFGAVILQLTGDAPMYLQFLLFLALCQERLPSSLVPEPRLIDSVLKPEKPNLEGAMELCGHQNFNLHVI